MTRKQPNYSRRGRTRLTALTILIIATTTASALSLDDLQRNDNLPFLCQSAYNSPIAGCSMREIQASSCDSTCESGLLVTQTLVQAACGAVLGSSDSLVAQAINGNLADFVCNRKTATVTATLSSTKTFTRATPTTTLSAAVSVTASQATAVTTTTAAVVQSTTRQTSVVGQTTFATQTTTTTTSNSMSSSMDSPTLGAGTTTTSTDTGSTSATDGATSSTATTTTTSQSQTQATTTGGSAASSGSSATTTTTTSSDSSQKTTTPGGGSPFDTASGAVPRQATSWTLLGSLGAVMVGFAVVLQ